MNRRRDPLNLLQKLNNRQIFGQFIRGRPLGHEPSKQLFDAVPARLVFNFRDTLPNIGNHILMGATRCGQLLLTYTYTVDPSSVFSPTHYRYRLHFWAFRPGRAAAKVAEVQLFDGSEILEVLTIGIVQWPNVNDRLLVFGNYHGPESIDSWGSDYEYKSTTYITVTTIPSLGGCADCRAVAASFDEEEMAANWDSGVGLTCLKHGLTLHTSFSVPYPYDFDPEVCAAVDDRVVINTGSFLHVLAFSIEKNGPAPSTPPPRAGPPTIVNAPLENRLGYSFLRDNGYSVFLSDTWACNMTQMLIDHIQQGHQVEVRELPFFLKLAIQKHVQSLKQSKSSPRPGSDSVITSLTEVSRRTSPPAGGRQQKWFSSAKTWRLTGLATAAVAAQGGGGGKPPQGTGKRPAEQVYDFEDSDEVGCEPKFKLYRRRCLADKMYEFRSDEDENIRPRPAVSSPLRQQRQASPPPPGSPNRQPDSVHKRQPIFFRCNVPTPEKVRNSLKLYDMHTDSETEEDSVPAPVAVVMSPNTGVGLRADINKVVRAIIADWESPEPELLGGAQSPPQPTSAAESRHSNVVAFVSSLLEGGKLPGAVQQAATRQRHRHRLHRRHTWSALKPTNRDLGDKPKQTVKSDQFELTDLMRREMERGFGHQPVTGCSVQFTRRYIEIDQEITSTITEIEDDEIGPGFQCALPLSVHGSAYAQMEMISNQKAEKLNMMCAVVTQSTLDIEHFCYKAAESICKMEGFKFWFCSDYDTEVINMCPATEDMLFVVFIRLNAEDLRLTNPNAQTNKFYLRNFYECSCVCIWSAARGVCYLEGYSGLRRAPTAAPKPWSPAGKEATALRAAAHGRHFGTNQTQPRSFVHRVRDGQIVFPLSLIVDHDNLIGFKRK